MSRDGLTCEEVLEQLFVFLDAELDQERSGDIERHLERCRECFSRAEFEKRLRRRLNEAGTAKAPERLQRRVKRLLHRY